MPQHLNAPIPPLILPGCRPLSTTTFPPSLARTPVQGCQCITIMLQGKGDLLWCTLSRKETRKGTKKSHSDLLTTSLYTEKQLRCILRLQWMVLAMVHIQQCISKHNVKNYSYGSWDCLPKPIFETNRSDIDIDSSISDSNSDSGDDSDSESRLTSCSALLPIRPPTWPTPQVHN